MPALPLPHRETSLSAMEITEIKLRYTRSAQGKALAETLADGSVRTLSLQGLTASAAPLIFASVADATCSTIVFILQDADEAGYFYHDMTQASGIDSVLFFPSSYRRAAKYGQRDAANEILRTEVLSRLAHPADSKKPLYIVTHPEAVSELVVARSDMDANTVRLSVNERVDYSALQQKLCSIGFSRVDYVYEPGQFAVRGSIVDVYSYSSELPFRIDFFDDVIDSIRTFGTDDQLSRSARNTIDIIPEMATRRKPRSPFTAFLPETAIVAAKDWLYVRETIDRIYSEGFAAQVATERIEGATEQERDRILAELRAENNFVTAATLFDGIAQHRTIEFGTARTPDIIAPNDESHATISFDITPQPLFHKNFDLLTQTLDDYIARGYTLYILADSEKQTRRLRDIFDSLGHEKGRQTLPDIVSQPSDRSPQPPAERAVYLPFTPINRTIHAGFADDRLRACFFTDHQIFDRFHKYSLRSDTARAGKVALTMKELQEMEPGDYLVHTDFGIGRFGGLVRVPVGNSYKEAIRIIYQRGDIVDVSIHSLYKISKYRRNGSGDPPRLSTLGTGAWERLKERTKAKIKDMARDLIKLYARRRHERGFAFSTDTSMQHELEAGFLYEDTPDQLRATNEVKADMESARPMDRLVCGDVGFGKTEVAVRAAFKAACDGKQTAVLVPTTVLAFQHYQTFSERLRDFPVRVEYLSRARTPRQTRLILDDLKAGRIDILVGTHKIIGRSVEWHDLGLLVIDEEQKFGVAVKERLRRLKTNVDTLTMSATPIPRTLQFSLMGARDMSIIRTPPPNRYPIHTETGTFSHEIIADAVGFEMSRNGQVYIVSSRIAALEELATMVHKYVPDARVAVGHGQMDPSKLEQTLIDFINYDYDVLVSTTIVENGIDIGNANTIIVCDAHRFGLSDLHQMRGRVGRSNRKAFCYLLAPPKSALSPEARRRLEAIETFSGLGSGFNLAMQDLDIRGAGNLLGAEQSGFMEDLGYETYQKILNQAVTELKNDEFADLYDGETATGRKPSGCDFVEDCSLESDLEMYFPDSYVPGSGERMLLYRELDSITDDDALNAYRRRLIDRFGPVPHEGEELLRVVPLRRLGRQLGCEKIMLKQGTMRMQFVSNIDSPYYRSATFDSVINYVTRHPRRCDLRQSSGKNILVLRNVTTVDEALGILREMQTA